MNFIRRIAALALITAMAGGLSVWALPLLPVPMQSPAAAAVTMIIALAISACIVTAAIHPDRRLGKLPERLHPACMKCGYNLTGNQSGRCPECGQVHEVSK